MIERAVFSYINPIGNYDHRCGFSRYSDFLYTTALAVWCAARHFKEVIMVSDDWGVEMFQKIGLPVTSYSNKLNEMKGVSSFFWAYGKLLAYNDQEVPFVHLDNDVFLWDPLPERILKADLCFQSHEFFELEGYKYYEMLRPVFDEAPVKPKVIEDNVITDYAYNCGICGGHLLDFFKEWITCSAHYIFAPENQRLFFDKYLDIAIHQNLFHEQYFAASLVKKYGLREMVEVISPDVTDIPKVLAYTHLWGTTKRDYGMMRRVNLRLNVEDRELHGRVKNYCLSHKI